MGMSGGDIGIAGLASGLDIQSLVKKAMIPQERQYNQLKAKEQKAEWTKDAYNSWYKQLSDFQNNTLFKYALSSGLMPKKTSSTDPSVVTATAGGAATCLSHQVTVNNLTSNAFLQTINGITRSNPAKDAQKSIKLSDIIGITDVKLEAKTGKTSPTDTLTFTGADGKSYTLKGDQMDQTAISFTLRDGSTISNSDTGVSAKAHKTITFSYRDLAEGTLNDLASKISNAGLNITAQYDSVNDSFSIYNTKGGKANTIDLTIDDVKGTGLPAGLSSSLLNTQKLLGNLDLGQYQPADNKMGPKIDGNWFETTPTGDLGQLPESGHIIAGVDGSVVIDGKTYSGMTSNQITVNGVTYTINATKPNQSINVSVSIDDDTIIKNAQQFVDDYNKLLMDLKKAANTRPDPNFQPLTDDQKKEMTPDQITKWTEKAKAGLLYNSEPLVNLMDQMRSAVNATISNVGGKYNSLYSIGISLTPDWTPNKSGLLTLDKDKLRKAISTDPNIVYKLFNNPSADEKDPSTFGVVKRLNKALTEAIGTGSLGKTATGIRGMAGTTDATNYSDQSYWGNKIANLKQQMAAFQKNMNKYQKSLYNQFNQMEVSISNMNSQYGFVAGFGG